MWMARVYYVDVAIPSDRKKWRRRKTHAVFDGSKVFRVGKLTELEDASEIYIDTLFSELYDEILELLRRGVRVYLLKNTTKLKKLRIENNLRKSDETDAVLLARIPKEIFRPLTVEELEIKARIRPLIRKYERIVRWKKTLKMLVKDGFDYNFRESIRLMEADGKRISEKIVRQVTSFPIYGEVYRKACEILGVKRSVELAILVVELPLHLPLVRLKGLLGLIPNRNGGKYYHRLRRHIAAFAASLYLCATRKDTNISDDIIEVVNNLPERQAIPRLELMTLKALRTAYLVTVKSPAGG